VLKKGTKKKKNKGGGGTKRRQKKNKKIKKDKPGPFQYSKKSMGGLGMDHIKLLTEQGKYQS